MNENIRKFVLKLFVFPFPVKMSTKQNYNSTNHKCHSINQQNNIYK